MLMMSWLGRFDHSTHFEAAEFPYRAQCKDDDDDNDSISGSWLSHTGETTVENVVLTLSLENDSPDTSKLVATPATRGSEVETFTYVLNIDECKRRCEEIQGCTHFIVCDGDPSRACTMYGSDSNIDMFTPTTTMSSSASYACESHYAVIAAASNHDLHPERSSVQGDAGMHRSSTACSGKIGDASCDAGQPYVWATLSADHTVMVDMVSVVIDDAVMDDLTLTHSGCRCPGAAADDTSCACCVPGACACGSSHPSRCVRCGSTIEATTALCRDCVVPQ